MNKVAIISATRTPIGSFLGELSSISATDLGSKVIEGLLEDISSYKDKIEIDEVFMGNVLSAGLGQAPARQSAIKGGLSDKIPCTTINKVCSSGMKSISLGVQSIALGINKTVICGGMESMSNVPHYMNGGRKGSKLGNFELSDGLILDGLTDVYNQKHMGICAELCAKKYKISREEQDEYAIESYKRSTTSWAEKRFDDEIVPVEIKSRKGSITISEDEEYKNFNFDKFKSLRPVFEKDGTVTAGNASTINDGAAGVLLMDLNLAKELGLKPLAVIKGFSDSAQKPEMFTTSPTLAIEKLLANSDLSKENIDYYEINEAFSVVSLANISLLKLDKEIVNVNGGAVSLGHPLGCSGARIVVSLINILKQNSAEFGVAGICNGGGGASAMLIENFN